MAGKKKEAEGIALLSMYNDEDMDLDDEESEEEDANSSEGINADKDNSRITTGITSPSIIQSQTPVTESRATLKSPAPPTPRSQVALSSPQVAPSSQSDYLDVQTLKKSSLGIVDYAHDETAMSPEAQDEKIEDSGRISLDVEPNVINERTPGTAHILTPHIPSTSPQPSGLSEQPENETGTPMDYDAIEPKPADIDMPEAISEETLKGVDPLEKFLPPPPKTKCSEELQERINKFLAYKAIGKSFNADLRNRKDYRNPDFLLHAVTYQEIDQIGTCFNKDVFDPHGYDPSDYYDKIEADMKQEMEKKEQERKKSQKVEFVQGGVQPGTVVPPPKSSTQIPVPGVSTVGTTSGLLSAPPVSDGGQRDGRQNKKTKWDKVDGDRRNPLYPGVQDNVAVGAHAAILSAANVGAGYTAFAQQKRKEAEEKRSSGRRLDRRS